MSDDNSLSSVRELLERQAEAEAARAKPLSSRERRARSVARLAAVQALYQMEVASIGVEAVIREFTDHRFGRELDDGTLADADEDFFAEIVRGVVADQAAIDAAVAGGSRRVGVSSASTPPSGPSCAPPGSS